MNQSILLLFLILQYPYITLSYEEYYLDGYEITPGVVSIPLRPMYYLTKKDNRRLSSETSENDETDLFLRRLQEEDVAEGEEDSNKKRTYLGTQFADLYIGEPAILRPLAVSTKSEFTAFPCRGCSDCGTSTQLYDSTASPTFSYTKCGECTIIPDRKIDTTTTECDGSKKFCYIKEDFIQKGSWEGLQSLDYAYIGGAKIDYSPKGTDVPRKYGFPLSFACQTSVKGWFVTNYRDGILAMSDSPTSFINQMYDSNKLAQRMFSLCFGFANKGGGASPGALTLGGSDPKYHDTPTVFMENTRANGESFTLYLKKIWLRAEGGDSVHPPRDGMKVYPVSFDVAKVNNPTGVILDSSMPYTSLRNDLDAGFRAAWLKATGQIYTYGRIRLLDGDLDKLPTILFQFQGDANVDRNIDPNTVPGLVGDLDPTSPFDVLFAVSAHSYMEYNPASGFYRTRLTFTNPTDNIFGANAMQGHDLCFDLGTQRVGVAESRQCKPREQSESGAADDDLFASPVDIISQDGFIMPFNTNNKNGGDLNGNGMGTNANGDGDDLNNRKFKNDPSDMDGGATFGPNASITSIGACTTMLCRAFLGIGYVVSLVTIFVLYKCSNMKKSNRYHIAEHEDDFYRGDDEYEDTTVQDQYYYGGEGGSRRYYDDSKKHDDFDDIVDTYNQSIYQDKQALDDFNESIYKDEQDAISDYNMQLHGNDNDDAAMYNRSLYGNIDDRHSSSPHNSRHSSSPSRHSSASSPHDDVQDVYDEYNKTFHDNVNNYKNNIVDPDVDSYNREMYDTKQADVDSYNREIYDDAQQEVDDYNRQMYRDTSPHHHDDYSDSRENNYEVETINRDMYGDSQQEVDSYNQEMYGNQQEVDDYNREMYGDEHHQDVDDYNQGLYGDTHQEVDDYNRQMYDTNPNQEDSYEGDVPNYQQQKQR